MTTFVSRLISIIQAEVGVEEINGTNCGPRVNEFKAATNLTPTVAWPWCAAFVCWGVREAMLALPDQRFTFARPVTAGAFDFRNWSLRQDSSTHTKDWPADDINAGDIVIFNFSHIGIAVLDAQDGRVTTVEGNTDLAGSREGGGVWRKSRKTSSIKTRIRFTV